MAEHLYEILAQALPFDVSNIDMEREYQFGLEVLIEGFKSKVEMKQIFGSPQN